MDNVRLIGIIQPTIEECDNTEQLLAFAARVSSTANQTNHETGGKLLRFLMKRREWSPLEMVSLTMEITTSRDIARQILRHRSFSFQEFSQRYAKADDQLILREARLQDLKDRQNSIETRDTDLKQWWKEEQEYIWKVCYASYEDALKRGIAKEVARAVLPEGLTCSKMYMAGTLRSWIHYVTLRCERKTQKEHRLIAEQCAQIICNQFPELSDIIKEAINT